MTPHDSAAALAFCGSEPAYYQTTDLTYLEDIRAESSQHRSWESCIADYAHNHPPKIQEWTPTWPSQPPADPYVRPLDTSMQIWIQEHDALLIALGVLAVIVLIGLFLAIYHRRGSRSSAVR